MPFPLALNIGAETPDIINIKCIKRARQIKGTDQWQVTDKLVPEDPNDWITLTEDQYIEAIKVFAEHMEEKIERRRDSNCSCSS